MFKTNELKADQQVLKCVYKYRLPNGFLCKLTL